MIHIGSSAVIPELRAMDQFPRVRVAGTAKERGRQYGKQARDQVHRSVTGYRDVFAHYTGWDWDQVRREASGPLTWRKCGA